MRQGSEPRHWKLNRQPPVLAASQLASSCLLHTSQATSFLSFLYHIQLSDSSWVYMLQIKSTCRDWHITSESPLSTSQDRECHWPSLDSLLILVQSSTVPSPAKTYTISRDHLSWFVILTEAKILKTEVECVCSLLVISSVSGLFAQSIPYFIVPNRGKCTSHNKFNREFKMEMGRPSGVVS